MKKIYSLMLALFATLCVGTLSAKTTADTLSFTLNVDHPEAIEVMVSDYVNNTIIPVVKGDNTIKVPAVSWGGYANVYVTVQDGWGIASIDHNLPETDPDYDYTPTFYGENGEWSLYVSGACAGLTYTVVSYDLSAARSDSLLVWIDNKNGAGLAYAAGNTISLKDSIWNVVRFSPDSALKDIPLQVNPIGNVYQVKLNGKVLPLTPGMGYWNPDHYSLAGAVNGDSVEIHVNAPADLTYPVIFNFAEPEMKAALDSVYVDGEKVEKHDTINVAWGKSIQVYFNTTGYAITINNNQLYGKAYNNTITDTLVLNIEAIAYHDFNVTLKVHNPNWVAVSCYINGNYTTLTDLKDGVDTVLTLSSKQPLMMVRKNDDCKVDSVLVDGKKELNYSQFTCNDNSVIEIFADSVRRTLDLMLYVADASAFSYTSFQNGSYRNMLPGDGKLQAGYTPIKFDESDNDFYIYISPKPVYYQNDSLIELGYMSSCYPTFANGDVFKIFADTAEVYNVEFVLNGEATTSNVTKDRIVAVEAANFTVLQGTEVSFETEETTILVNGEAVKAVEGVVTVTIVANTTIEVGVEPSIANTAENPYTIAEAIALTEAGVALTDTVFVIGVVKNIGTTAANIQKYGNVDVYLTQDTLEYQFRYMLNVGGEKFANIDEVNATFTSGDTLIAKGTLTYYAAKNRYQLNQYCQLVEVRKVPIIEEPSIANTAENPYTVTEAIELTKAGVSLTDSVYVIGIVDSLQYVADYKDVNVWVHDSLNRMEFYAMYGFNRDSINSEEDLAALVAVGDTLIAKGTLTYYAKGDIYELNRGCYAIEVRKAAVEPEPEPEIAQYQLHGSWVENWGGPVLEIADDKATASATVELNEGSYDFGIKQLDADGAQTAWLWTANTEGDTFTREANVFVFVNQKEVSGKNPTLAADVDGEYTFVWTYADNTLTITFPAKPEGIFNATVEGQAEKFVRDGQLIIRMNGVEYNVLGAKLQ